MSSCVCQRAKLSGRKEPISAELASSMECYIIVNDEEAYIEAVCDDCDKPLFVDLECCPICGRRLK